MISTRGGGSEIGTREMLMVTVVGQVNVGEDKFVNVRGVYMRGICCVYYEQRVYERRGVYVWSVYEGGVYIRFQGDSPDDCFLLIICVSDILPHICSIHFLVVDARLDDCITIVPSSADAVPQP